MMDVMDAYTTIYNEKNYNERNFTLQNSKAIINMKPQFEMTDDQLAAMACRPKVRTIQKYHIPMSPMAN